MPGFSQPDFTGQQPLITRASPHPSHQMILGFMKISLTTLPQLGSHAGTGPVQLLPCSGLSQCCALASSTTGPQGQSVMQGSRPGAVPAFQGGKVAQEREGTGCVLLHAYTSTAPAQLATVLWGWNGCHGQTGEVAAPRASLAPPVPPALGNQHITLTKGLSSPSWGLGRASPSSF